MNGFLSPLPILRAGDEQELARVTGKLSGENLVSVSYIIPKEGHWPDGRHIDGVHEVDDGVKLSTTSDAVLIRWGMAGYVEGLSAQIVSKAATKPDPALLRELDMSGSSRWRQFLAKPLFIAGFATHVAPDASEATIWSLRFASKQGPEVVIALGEWTKVGPSYIPDNLLAIFDEAVARSFTIPDNPVSAWGLDWEFQR